MLLVTLTSSLLVLLVGQQQVQAWWFSAPVVTKSPVKARASFDLDGVQGEFVFTQYNASEPTHCNYYLKGLKGNNRLYHVHVRPVPDYDRALVSTNISAISELCSDPSTGGHLNPHHITIKLPSKSAPFDQYETGDLSGKHGPLLPIQGSDDVYQGSFDDDKLPMSGENSIVGRSIVIHKNDGKRWVCANIIEVQ